MNAQDLRNIWHTNPNFKANVSTKVRKDILLSNDLRAVFEGKSYEIKFNSLGGGVWEAYIEKLNF